MLHSPSPVPTTGIENPFVMKHQAGSDPADSSHPLMQHPSRSDPGWVLCFTAKIKGDSLPLHRRSP
ncbi:MAG: hypothetical protein JWM59_1672 [Verrucomicrobiales bacterium]|nr:hypothetical protein [Verrucomicrobiales bacterium]